jgi:hypothetical protein
VDGVKHRQKLSIAIEENGRKIITGKAVDQVMISANEKKIEQLVLLLKEKRRSC